MYATVDQWKPCKAGRGNNKHERSNEVTYTAPKSFRNTPSATTKTTALVSL